MSNTLILLLHFYSSANYLYYFIYYLFLLLFLAVHRSAPSKVPSLRIDQLRIAGELQIPFTTGLLLGDRMWERRRQRGYELQGERESEWVSEWESEWVRERERERLRRRESVCEKKRKREREGIQVPSYFFVISPIIIGVYFSIFSFLLLFSIILYFFILFFSWKL